MPEGMILSQMAGNGVARTVAVTERPGIIICIPLSAGNMAK